MIMGRFSVMKSVNVPIVIEAKYRASILGYTKIKKSITKSDK